MVKNVFGKNHHDIVVVDLDNYNTLYVQFAPTITPHQTFVIKATNEFAVLTEIIKTTATEIYILFARTLQFEAGLLQ